MLLPRCIFGIITDVHYADVDDGYNFKKTCRRYYRGAYEHMLAVNNDWAINSVQFGLQLGDFIDGRNNILPGESDQSLKKILSVLSQHRLYHVWGNHELYNYKRAQMFGGRLDSTSRDDVDTPFPGRSAYYTFLPSAGIRVVVLDVYAISVLGHEKDSPIYAEATEFMRERNHNEDWNSADGLRGNDVCYVKFNGAVGAEQLEWLETVLGAAEGLREKVIVIGHAPIFAESCDPACLCWDHEAVLSSLQRYSGTVVAYFSGHDHSGGQAIDSARIHHVTFPGVVEAVPGQKAGVIVRVYDDKMNLSTGGRLGNLDITL